MMLDRPRKKATNVTLDADLLAEARELGINLSQTLESALAERVRTEKARRWKAENRDAIEDYNRFVQEHGVFGDRFRSF